MRLGLREGLALVLVLASMMGASATGASCLPSLSSVAADAAGPSPSAICGDGIIEPDSGEECDPGPPPGAAGCTKACKVQCTGGYVNPLTDHCYFLLFPQDASTSNLVADSKSGCKSTGNNAHVVTIGGARELGVVTGASDLISVDTTAHFWVGLRRNVDAGSSEWISQDTYAEPGWAPSGSCPGCYAVTVTPPPKQFPGSIPGDASTFGCVIDSKAVSPSWLGAPCFGVSSVAICEREPPGLRAVSCGAGSSNVCITLPPKISQKSYEYYPSAVTAEAAEATCMTAGGSLVVFESVEEREALNFQLLNLAQGTAPHAYWIGLSRQSGDVPTSPWSWDDGNGLDGGVDGSYPNPWGLDAPETPGTTRAYTTFFTGTALGRAVDVQLAHAAGTATTTMPFVCQNPK